MRSVFVSVISVSSRNRRAGQRFVDIVANQVQLRDRRTRARLEVDSDANTRWLRRCRCSGRDDAEVGELGAKAFAADVHFRAPVVHLLDHTLEAECSTITRSPAAAGRVCVGIAAAAVAESDDVERRRSPIASIAARASARARPVSRRDQPRRASLGFERELVGLGLERGDDPVDLAPRIAQTLFDAFVQPLAERFLAVPQLVLADM